MDYKKLYNKYKYKYMLLKSLEQRGGGIKWYENSNGNPNNGKYPPCSIIEFFIMEIYDMLEKKGLINKYKDLLEVISIFGCQYGEYLTYTMADKAELKEKPIYSETDIKKNKKKKPICDLKLFNKRIKKLEIYNKKHKKICKEIKAPIDEVIKIKNEIIEEVLLNVKKQSNYNNNIEKRIIKFVSLVIETLYLILYCQITEENDLNMSERKKVFIQMQKIFKYHLPKFIVMCDIISKNE